MKLFYKNMLVVIGLLLGIHQVNGVFDPLYLRDLQSCFKSETENLSPVNGALLVESNFLKNFYTWGPDEWPTYRLARSLFHVLREGTIRLGQQKSNWVKGLDGELVGHIVGWLENGAKDDQKQVLQNEWYEKYKNASERLGHHQKINKNVGIENLKLIRESFYFNPEVTVSILTAVLYLKEDEIGVPSKKKMVDYLVALKSWLSDEIFIEPLTEQKEEDLLRSCYVVDELIDGDSLEINAIKSIVKVNSGICSPKIVQGNYRFNGQEARPNCVETAMLDVLCILLFDPHSKKFKLDSLSPEIQASMHERLRNFFIKNSDPSAINAPKVQQEWMDTVSNIADLGLHTYVSGSFSSGYYEMDSDIAIFLNMLNYLFGITAGTWQELCERLSTQNNHLMCDLQDDVQNKCKIVELQSSKFGLVKIYFEEGHVHMAYEERDLERNVCKPLFCQENVHMFYAFDILDVNVGLQALFGLGQNSEISYELLRECALALIRKKYCQNDGNLNNVMFSFLYSLPGQDDLLEHLVPAIASLNDSFIFYCLIRFFEEYDATTFNAMMEQLVNLLPERSRGFDKNNTCLFNWLVGDVSYFYGAFLLGERGCDISHAVVLPRRVIRWACKHASERSVKASCFLLFLDNCNNNDINDRGRSVWHDFCDAVTPDTKFLFQVEIADILFELVEQNKCTVINSLTFSDKKSPLDILLEKRESFCTAFMEGQYEALVEKMRAHGAKTAQELDLIEQEFEENV